MQFTLFSKISFDVSNPVWLIEAYCFLTDFYQNYDLISRREIVAVNRIGARIKKSTLRQCKAVLEAMGNLRLFESNLDELLCFDEKKRKDYIDELSAEVIAPLLEIRGIGFSKVTKLLHTIYPEIIPMIDNPLQELYRSKVNPKWSDKHVEEIFIDYYENLLEKSTLQNLNEVFSELRDNHLFGLTKLRVFDIIWWSYLRSESLRLNKNIKWSSITELPKTAIQTLGSSQ
jgi:hypothetical protein